MERLEAEFQYLVSEADVTGQLESRHFFRAGDMVSTVDGTLGTIIEERTLYAVVEWSDGAREEIDQFDPRITVVQRRAE